MDTPHCIWPAWRINRRTLRRCCWLALMWIWMQRTLANCTKHLRQLRWLHSCARMPANFIRRIWSMEEPRCTGAPPVKHCTHLSWKDAMWMQPTLTVEQLYMWWWHAIDSNAWWRFWRTMRKLMCWIMRVMLPSTLPSKRNWCQLCNVWLCLAATSIWRIRVARRLATWLETMPAAIRRMKYSIYCIQSEPNVARRAAQNVHLVAMQGDPIMAYRQRRPMPWNNESTSRICWQQPVVKWLEVFWEQQPMEY